MLRKWSLLLGAPLIAGAALLIVSGSSLAQHGGGGGGGHGGGGGGGHGGGGHASGSFSGGGHSSWSGGGHSNGSWNNNGHWNGNGSWNHGNWNGHGHDWDRFGFGFGFYSPWWYWGPGYGGYYNGYYGGGYSDYPYYSGATYPSENYIATYPPSADDEGGASTPQQQMDPSRAAIFVHVPSEAELWFGGQKMSQKGEFRQFETPSLAADEDYSYEVRARWMVDGKPVESKRKLMVRAGDRLGLDFAKPPRDRK